MEQVNGLEVLKNVKLPHGLMIVGEFRGIEQRESKGNTYYKLKVLLGDYVEKFDIKPEQYGEVKNTPIGKHIVVSYYKFPSKFDRNIFNQVCTAFCFLEPMKTGSSVA